jgi:hypothetical protein
MRGLLFLRYPVQFRIPMLPRKSRRYPPASCTRNICRLLPSNSRNSCAVLEIGNLLVNPAICLSLRNGNDIRCRPSHAVQLVPGFISIRISGTVDSTSAHPVPGTKLYRVRDPTRACCFAVKGNDRYGVSHVLENVREQHGFLIAVTFLSYRTWYGVRGGRGAA